MLVVVAIIGILSAVVLASLSTARNRGKDAAVKSALASARAEVEILADGKAYSATYDGTNYLCNSSVLDTVNPILKNIATNIGNNNGIPYASNPVGCSVSTSGSNIEIHALLSSHTSTAISSTDKGWCVDSDGFNGEITAVSTNLGKCQ